MQNRITIFLARSPEYQKMKKHLDDAGLKDPVQFVCDVESARSFQELYNKLGKADQKLADYAKQNGRTKADILRDMKFKMFFKPTAVFMMNLIQLANITREQADVERRESHLLPKRFK
jgi:hypothetical protein